MPFPYRNINYPSCQRDSKIGHHLRYPMQEVLGKCNREGDKTKSLSCQVSYDKPHHAGVPDKNKNSPCTIKKSKHQGDEQNLEIIEQNEIKSFSRSGIPGGNHLPYSLYNIPLHVEQNRNCFSWEHKSPKSKGKNKAYKQKQQEYKNPG